MRTRLRNLPLPCLSDHLGEDISAVAKRLIIRNSSKFDGMCRLKSTRLCTSSPQHAVHPQSRRVLAKESPSFFRKRSAPKKRTPRNQAQQSPPTTPVSARI